MAQRGTGRIAEQRVITKLKSFGLMAYKPVPDFGIDIITHPLGIQFKTVKIQVKGRNPEKDPNLRWFQIRVTQKELQRAKNMGIEPDQSWINKVNMVDFFILDAVKVNEMWVLPINKVFELIKLNEQIFAKRPDNIFTYDSPIKDKQKEMNLDIIVNGEKLTEKFKSFKNKFSLILQQFDFQK